MKEECDEDSPSKQNPSIKISKVDVNDDIPLLVPDSSPPNESTELPKLKASVPNEKAGKEAIPIRGMNKVRSEARVAVQKLDSVDRTPQSLQAQLPAKRLAPIARVDKPQLLQVSATD